jgi:hypothetical protein
MTALEYTVITVYSQVAKIPTISTAMEIHILSAGNS